MFKGKSPIGKENVVSEWFAHEQPKKTLSPIKNQHTNKEHSFANARRGKHNYPERDPNPSHPTLLRRLSDPLDLECNETL